MTVKVRFAPSPTGFLHIGNARAALVNWLFAKKHQGHFMLRLDDTDLARSKPEFEQGIYDDLQWLGLTHQSFAKQSERFARYDQVVEKLKESGRLYPCYESQEELDFKRKRQLARGGPPVYDRTALNLSEAQKNELEAAGVKPHWRFKLNDETVRWCDLVRGEVEFQTSHLSDPVMIKTDGTFLYTITSVIDDVDFEITHVLRGEDHVTNTAVQIQLFKALNPNFDIQFGHTTLLMDAQGQALSKRLGSLGIKDLKNMGIEPMSINSLLARLGTSMPIEALHHLSDLASTFDLSTFSRTPPKFDEKELFILNQKLFQETAYKDLAYKEINEKEWDLIKGNITTKADIAHWRNIFNSAIVAPYFGDDDKQFLNQALNHFPEATLDQDTWGLWTNILKEISSRKGRELFTPLRLALTGLEHGPEMKKILPILGAELIKQRLARAINA